MTPAGRSRRALSPWSWTYGARPHTVYARERLDRDGVIELRYSDSHKAGRDKRRKLFLDSALKVRNARGTIERQLVRTVEETVKQINARLVSGTPVQQPDAEEKNDELTLADGFRKLLHPKFGKFSDVTAKHVKYHVRPRSKIAITTLRAELDATGEPMPTWTTFRPAHARILWRALALTYKKRKTGGMRAAEQIVDALYSAAAWLRQEEYIPPTACIAPPKWRKQLKEEWQEITGVVYVVQRPRHSRTEVRQIFDVLADPNAKIDPRIRLAIELGAELRGGQVLRTKRSQLEIPSLTPDAYETLYMADLASSEPTGVLGRVAILGRPKKPGEVVIFTPEQRRAVDTALEGYLRDWEAQYQGNGVDYYLFPAGKLVKGVSKVVPCSKVVNELGPLKWFRELEVVAGVTHMLGRGWYGLRRSGTDVAPDYSSDARELNALGGWTDSETRETIYQDRQALPVRARASAVRRAARAGVGRAVTSADQATPSSATDPIVQALLHYLTPAQLAQLVALSEGSERLKSGADLRAVVPKVGPDEKTSGPTRSGGILLEDPSVHLLSQVLAKQQLSEIDPSEGHKAGDGARTHDIQLGKLTLYQLSYTRGISPLFTRT
jgi:hypothetical protein